MGNLPENEASGQEGNDGHGRPQLFSDQPHPKSSVCPLRAPQEHEVDSPHWPDLGEVTSSL